MNDHTRIFVSTSLWNKDLSISANHKDGSETKVKNSSQEKTFNLQQIENRPKQKERTPSQPTPSVPDSIDSPKKTRKVGPNEEFIETDPNWAKEKSGQNKKEANQR